MNQFVFVLKIQYLGAKYSGWQIQPERPTIQGALNQALAKICKSQEIKSLGSGRTDAGVNALGQVVKISIPLEIAPGPLVKAINSSLPVDIRVLQAARTTEEFHPIYNAVGKHYRYVFTQGRPSCFQEGHIASLAQSIDFDLVSKACKIFQGTHDFQNYQCVGTPVATTEREVFRAELIKNDPNFSCLSMWDEVYSIGFHGTGFLKQMVRLMVGAIWEVGKGRVSLSELENSLSGQKLDRHLGPVAPAQGLYLESVDYGRNIFNS